MNDIYQKLQEIYESENVPWDDPLPPPEVLEIAGRLPPGRGLDLGCGYGRAAIYLAQRGWQVDAVELMEIALREAKRRAKAAGVDVRFHAANVTDLSFLSGPYDLVVDVGCSHVLGPQMLEQYYGEIQRLLRPDGLFLLFARLYAPGQKEGGPQGLVEAELLPLTARHQLALENRAKDETVMDDGTSWPSAWYLFRRGETDS